MSNRQPLNVERQPAAHVPGRSGKGFQLSKEGFLLILNWLIVAVVALLVIVIYIPQRIWAEEDVCRTESRRRMDIIQDAEEFYQAMRGDYSTDGPFLLKLVSQAHDSLIGDSTFIGEQIIHVDGSPIPVSIPEFTGQRMDTTFTVGRQLRKTVQDTTYTVTLWNTDRGAHDTLYFSSRAALRTIMADPAFGAVLDTLHGSHSEVYTDYDWNRFRLEPKLLNCPVTGDPFIIEIDSTGSELRIASPIAGRYIESRFLIFKFETKTHGEIVAGQASWRRR